MNVLITGSAGLVGSECCRLLYEKGFKVISVDNYMRGKILGEDANTSPVMRKLLKECDIEHHEVDFRSERILPLVKKSEAVIHAAAQPSHPKSIEIPTEDFQINAWGTLLLLETIRRHNRDAIFLLCSTNKVYGDVPNYFRYRKIGKRFEPEDPFLKDGFDETLRIDRCLHTPFGVSKATADLYTQEYSSLYKLQTGIFRMGCITGGAAMAVELHNWEPYFVKKALNKEKLTIFGYGGYQVRDVIHARDLAELFHEFIKNPNSGEVYNIGGGRTNSISLLEAIDLIQDLVGHEIDYTLGPPREGDHVWWISKLNKIKAHYSQWRPERDLKSIFKEIYETLVK